MNKTSISIQYPALIFMESDGLIYAFDDPIEYLDTSGLILYKNCIVVDNTLRLYKVTSINNDGWAFLWGYNPLKYSGRAVKISFNIEKSEIINLKELKSLILDFLSRKTTPLEFWYNNESTEKMKEYVKNNEANSFNDIYKIFNEDID